MSNVKTGIDYKTNKIFISIESDNGFINTVSFDHETAMLMGESLLADAGVIRGYAPRNDEKD